MNLVMTSSGEFIELQGTGEEATFTESQLADLLALGKSGIHDYWPRRKKQSLQFDFYVAKSLPKS